MITNSFIKFEYDRSLCNDKKKKAIKTLEELRANNLIDFTSKNNSEKNHVGKEKILTHLATEKSLAKLWLTQKEDLAWQDL